MRQAKITGMILTATILVATVVCCQLGLAQLAGWVVGVLCAFVLVIDGVIRLTQYANEAAELRLQIEMTRRDARVAVQEVEARAQTAILQIQTEAMEAREAATDSALALDAERAGFQAKLAEKMALAYAQITELEETVTKMDLVGQFLVLCQRWGAAKCWEESDPNWVAPVVAGVKMDQRYWWRLLGQKAEQIWTGPNWKDTDLLACAEQAATVMDLDRWNRLITSDFGFSLPVSPAKRKKAAAKTKP